MVAGVAAGALRLAAKRPAPPPPLHSPVPQWQPQPETRPVKGQGPPQAQEQDRFMPSTHCVIRKIIKVSQALLSSHQLPLLKILNTHVTKTQNRIRVSLAYLNGAMQRAMKEVSVINLVSCQ